MRIHHTHIELSEGINMDTHTHTHTHTHTQTLCLGAELTVKWETAWQS